MGSLFYPMNMPTLNSMTAYARDEQIIGANSYVWELRSVNHRYLDAHFRLPETLRGFEQALKVRLSKRVRRGRVDVTLNRLEIATAKHALEIDKEVIEKWSKWQDDIHAVIPNAAPLSVMELMNEGGVFGSEKAVESVEEETLLASFDQALKGLLDNRAAEGGRLQRVLQDKLEGIASISQALADKMPEYEQAHQAGWQAKLDGLLNDALDPVRLHQEVAILIAKSDVTEELDRLQSHVTEFQSAMARQQPAGRRLDFLLQEFNREANTLGSKSIHQEITNASVEMKVLIDQLREQVQNIE